MKKWENPSIDIRGFETEDVLTTSAIETESGGTFEDED